MSRIALLGGSFNPPHLAHQMICLCMLSTGRAEHVWLLPCFNHPFGKELVDFSHRMEMCKLAAAEFAEGKVLVSDVEAKMNGESRTLFTIKRLMTEHPQHKFSLAIGADILKEKDSWYRFDEIERLVEIIVLGRSGYDNPSASILLELPAISSTMIRQRLANDEDVSTLIPSAVYRYIKQHRLYGRKEMESNK